ncbi:hypothetical protein FHS78_002179 [Parvibaculum indicum]|uniref:hypothetical protein n=1 Tax=Parvibaculum indicum TaxID=562969 RepID=UPI00141E46C6|nr:hypothetical protein [Parvibaculum indicum]NIJ41889.1 hypothetical protein [Parvibaculum indicum]
MTLMKLYELHLKHEETDQSLDICLVLAPSREHALAAFGQEEAVALVKQASDWMKGDGEPRILGWTSGPMPGVEVA